MAKAVCFNRNLECFDAGSHRPAFSGLQITLHLEPDQCQAKRNLVNEANLTTFGGTIPVIAGSLGAATFPWIIRISCRRLPESNP